MAVKLYIFDESRDALEANLAAVGYSASDFSPPAGLIPDGPSNNPWQARNRAGDPIVLLPNAGLGYGWSIKYNTAEKAQTDIEAFRKAAVDNGRPDVKRLVGIDVAPTSMTPAPRGQHWCSNSGMGYHFGTRRHASQLIEAQALRQRNLTGNGVKVFLVDSGVSKDYIESVGGTYGGGMAWPVDGAFKLPGKGSSTNVAVSNQHGSMLMRSLIELAPRAEFYDLPLLPSRITDVENFSLRALFAFAFLKFFYLSNPANPGPWVILNAWGIVDRFAEQLRGYYTNDPDHYLNDIVKHIGESHDVVFAAGNSGQFCPDPRTTSYDQGPGRSIFGANGLSDVTSVGAVCTNGSWIGASSQGPGPAGFMIDTGRPEKPDLCAPSWYVENANAHLRNGGTSAASATVAGAIAALRQRWDTAAVSPEDMRTALQNGARRVTSPDWNERTGRGVLNLEGTITHLPA